MKLRLALGFVGLLYVACLPSSPPAGSPSDKPAAANAADAGAVSCDSLKIHSKADLDACNLKCKSDQREQQAQCGDPNCQAGIGTATRVCLGKCDDQQKAAKQNNCYKE